MSVIILDLIGQEMDLQDVSVRPPPSKHFERPSLPPEPSDGEGSRCFRYYSYLQLHVVALNTHLLKPPVSDHATKGFCLAAYRAYQAPGKATFIGVFCLFCDLNGGLPLCWKPYMKQVHLLHLYTYGVLEHITWKDIAITMAITT